MNDTPEELPPCIWCGGTVTKELASTLTSERERWFQCGSCYRVFRVLFMPNPDAIAKKHLH